MRRSFCTVVTERMHEDVRICMSPCVCDKPTAPACSRRPWMYQNTHCDYQAIKSMLFR